MSILYYERYGNCIKAAISIISAMWLLLAFLGLVAAEIVAELT